MDWLVQWVKDGKEAWWHGKALFKMVKEKYVLQNT
jgi:hypothetical protein